MLSKSAGAVKKGGKAPVSAIRDFTEQVVNDLICFAHRVMLWILLPDLPAPVRMLSYLQQVWADQSNEARTKRFYTLEKRSIIMNKLFDLSGKRAVVTGGSSGIGKAISVALATNGAKVVIFDLDEHNAQEVALEINNTGGEAIAVKCDVSNEQSVKDAMDGKTIDILINNAGIAHIGNVGNTLPEDMDRVYNVNVKGVYYCLREGVNLMKVKGGTIINVSSIAAHVGLTDRFAYSMSKGAVHAMTLSVARDYIANNIRCNSISPARVHTPFVDGFLANNYPGNETEMFHALSKTQPIGRMGKPEEIGSLVLYLCSEEASFITGSDFPIDGGFVTLNN